MIVTLRTKLIPIHIYIFIHHQYGSTVDRRRLNKIYNLTKQQEIRSVEFGVCPMQLFHF